jgi:peptidoglycan/xylan/chitin deacetylase (PgdA/CDA1 family)
MSALSVRWRRTAVVGLVAAGVAAGSVLTGVPAQAAAAKNLVGNGSAEVVNRQVPRGWAKGASGANTHVLTSVSGGAQSGRKFVRTKITKYRSGAAWWVTPAASVRGGSSYTYTEYYRSGSRTTLNAYFTVGRRTVGKPVAVLPAGGRWTAARYTVTAPAGASAVRFGHTLSSAGYLDVDNVALIAAAAAGRPSVPPTTSKTGLVSLTFDDGWANQATNAAPIMKAANMPGTFYLISGAVGSGSYMSVEQAKSLQASGSEIGSHTATHANLTTLDSAALTKELANSKTSLEAKFGPVTSLAYPYGAGNATVQAAAAKYYTSARTTDSGTNKRGANRYTLKIGYVLNTTSTATVQGWINEAKASNTWLILCYHRIANDQPTDAYTATVSNFQSQIDAIKASGLRVVTVRDGVKLTS